MNVDQMFSRSYAEQRKRFLQKTASLGMAVESFIHPLKGIEGEVLAMDVALFGRPDASRLLIINSGTHGVEGFCGSGVQLALLADSGFHAKAEAAGVAVLYIHAINPWGFSWQRRWTQENVDMNRNFLDFEDPSTLPECGSYAELADLLVPSTWPDPETNKKLMIWIEKNGIRALQEAVTRGQYTHPDGLFFCGLGPTWSNLTFRNVMKKYAAACTHLAMIDIHTALGPCGYGERILISPNNTVGVARAKNWWGKITSFVEGDSVSAAVFGTLCGSVEELCPKADVTTLALEYGTVPPLVVLAAMQADQWLANQANPDPAIRDTIKAQVMDAYYVDTEDWKRQVSDQGIEVASQAVAGLAVSGDTHHR